ncbi:MAG: CHAT domain-containing protein, partial [Gemmataceae bacterium]|nr:CHAT domain-containing protein [Gemmataceae bacterium]
ECEEAVSLRARGELGTVMWQTVPAAPTTGALLPESVARPEVCAREKVCIQFIGGDRGGATRPQLMLPREEKEIRDAVNLGAFRDRFAFSDTVHAASVEDVIACHRFNPGIVHFAGHGEERRLILVQDRDLLAQQRVLSAEQLVTLFRNYPKRVGLVFLNVCHSADLARGLASAGVVDMAIGVPGQLADDLAIFFARTFYRQLSDGLSVRQAFEMAGLQHAAGAARHELFAANGIVPEALTFRS